MNVQAKRFDPDTLSPPSQALVQANLRLAGMSAEERVAWALDALPGRHVLSSSFGAQAAVSLHMVARQRPDIPVILIDTGYLFEQTHAFAARLRERLDLDLHTFASPIAPAAMEAAMGRLWEQGADGIERYNRLRKVEPMQRALRDLDAGTWIAGLRRSQSRSRARIDFLEQRDGRWKLHPLADWSDRDVGMYLAKHDLPYHPLWEDGYVSIGDVHTTRRWEPGLREEDLRFFGLRRECGLHFDGDAERAA